MTLGQEARKAYSTMLHTSNPTQGNQQKKNKPPKVCEGNPVLHVPAVDNGQHLCYVTNLL